jgi:hypothetical protein
MKRALLYTVVFILTTSIYAQDVVLKEEYPSVVSKGQQFTVMYTVNTGGGKFSEPSFEGFYKLMGPQTSYSSSTEIINGRMSTQTSYSYVYYLQALNTGKFVIPPATFTYKNKEYSSDSLRIEVVAGAAQKQPATTGSGGAATGNQEAEAATDNDIFVTLSINRKEVYLGEHIVATVKIFTRVNLAGINEIKYPDFNGFLKSDIDTPPLTSLRQENINGKVYGTGVVQQFLLYPQVTGEVTIDPVQLSVLVQQKSGNSDPFFGDFFAQYENVPKAVASMPVKIKVKPLPGVQPENFSGVVGNINIKAGIDKDSVNVNDALTFKVTISGNGNLKIASKPEMKLSPDIEVYDPKVTDNIKNSASGTSGQKTFEYLLIPRHYGDYSIPPLSYSYFDVSKGKYVNLATPVFHFYAKKVNDQNSGITVYGGVAKEDVKYLGKDIRFIKSNQGRLAKANKIIVSGLSFFSLYAFALLVFFVVLFLRREHIRRNADLTLVRNRKAAKVAVKRLKTAEMCLKNNDIDKFYEEILKAVWGYLSDKLNIPVSDLTRTSAIDSLKKRDIEDNKIELLNSILDTCEYARFAPSGSGTEAENMYEGTSQFIKSVENSIH